MATWRWLALASLAVAGGCTQDRPAPVGPLPPHRLDMTPYAFYLTPPPPARPPANMPALSSLLSPPHPAAWEAAAPWPWRYIVIHHSATEDGNASEFDRMHRARGWDELGYHFVIDNGKGGTDGVVEVGSRWRAQKWGAHTGGTPNNEYNEYGIGICVVGNCTACMPTPAQIESLRKLVLYLAATYGIAPEAIISHRDAPNAKTECPGDMLWAYVHGALRQEMQRACGGDPGAANAQVGGR